MAGTDRYELGVPLFAKAEVRLAGRPLAIVADNYGPDHPFVSTVLLNSKPLDRWWIRHSELASGGELRFVLKASSENKR